MVLRNIMIFSLQQGPFKYEPHFTTSKALDKTRLPPPCFPDTGIKDCTGTCISSACTFTSCCYFKRKQSLRTTFNISLTRSLTGTTCLTHLLYTSHTISWAFPWKTKQFSSNAKLLSGSILYNTPSFFSNHDTHLTMFLCFSSLSKHISRNAELGTPLEKAV